VRNTKRTKGISNSVLIRESLNPDSVTQRTIVRGVVITREPARVVGGFVVRKIVG
jgi:hypothetical protein